MEVKIATGQDPRMISTTDSGPMRVHAGQEKQLQDAHEDPLR
jgi:hypothetical protein